MKEIDLDLYSRQIFTYGLEAMEKIVDLKILIIGLRGLGIEIAKNLMLSGPKELSISDKNICKINDLGSNFYISQNDINIKTREEACYKKLCLLNPYVNVTINDGNIKDNINKYNLIIISEILKLEELYEINEICRKNNIGFIYSLNLGLTGFLFNDFGDIHIINDMNGEKNLTYKIFNIDINQNNYEIFNLKKDDYVIFKEVKGLEELNDGIPRKIIKSSQNSFEIEKTNKINYNNEYINDGIVEEIKMPKRIKFNSLKDNLTTPNENHINIDSSKNYANILLHCAFVGLHKYYSLNDKLPEINNLKEINEVVDLSYQFYLDSKDKNIEWLKINKKHLNNNKLIEFNKSYIINSIKWWKCELNPICSFLGGIVSQEAIKIIGKYNPIYQWLRFEFFETIENIPSNCNRNLLNCRYDDQISIFGQGIQEKLSKLNIFMIGVGALGCEYLKNFALMGIGCNKEQNNDITVTDNDDVVKSNLNRQFLFKSSDIDKSKSFCACRETKEINDEISLKSFQYLVCDETKNIFDDDFWEKQNIIISAVDKISVRKYIDNQCTFYNKILIDAGTEGTNANFDIYYPNKTICLNDLTFNTKKQIPMCTLKNFPTEIQHCIEWSKIIFKELFNEYIQEIKLIINDEKKFYNLLNEEMNINELYIKLKFFKYLFYILENPNQQLIIQCAKLIFIYYFDFNINKLLNEQEKEFINGYNKRLYPLKINLNDISTINYFKSFYYILSNIINYDKNNYQINEEEIKTMIEDDNFNLNILSVNKEKLIEEFKNDIIEKIEKNMNNIKEKINLTKPIIFEKDNDANNHINFILSMSNLRAKNYNIKECNFLKAKEIAGNIIPAIASTTAAVVGLSCLQIYTILQTDDINYIRSGAFNLGVNEYDLFIPEEKRFIKDIPKTNTNPEYKVIPNAFTVWDKIDLYGPLNINSIVNDFKKKYNVDLDYINYNNIILASPMEETKDFNKTIEELIKEKTGNNNINNNLKYIKLNFNGSIGDSEIQTPTIRYIIKK